MVWLEAFRAGNMKPLHHAVDALAKALGIDAAEVARRKAFLALGEKDAAALRELHGLLREVKPGIADAFYNHLLSFEETRALLPDAAAVERLKRAQAVYFDSLTAGDYGWDYIQNRLRVGVAHERVGLEPKWYIGAYSKYLSGLLPEIWRVLDGDRQAGHAGMPPTGGNAQKFLDACQALLKVVLLDMQLAIDTYIYADRQAVLALREYSEKVFASIPDSLLVLSSALRVLSVNHTFLERFGLSMDAIKGRHLLEVLKADGLRGRALEVLATGVAQHGILFSMGVAGSNDLNPARVTLTGIRLAEEEEEEEARLLLIIEDLTEEEKLRAAALESERRFRDLAETANDGIIMVDTQGKIAYFNRAAERMFGYHRNQVLGQRVEKLIPGPHLLEAGGAPLPSWEAEGCRRDDSVFPVEGSASVFKGSTGRFVTYVLRDLSERKRFEEQLLHMANHDALTGLANRNLLLDRLELTLAQARRNESLTAVLFLDLDRFKIINDTLGHAFGDLLLKSTAERLQSCVRDEDTIARLGGDEFIVLLADLHNLQDAAIVAQKIIDALSQPILLEGSEIFVTTSIGITLFPHDGNDGNSLLKNADTAMYRAKEQGRNAYQFYTADMNAQASARLTMETGLRKALGREEFLLHYQPQVDLNTGNIVGVEALLRWRHPQMGLISPDEFIPMAEETGLIIPIGEWVLYTACAQCRNWPDAGCGPLRIAVNLSARQFRQKDLADTVARILNETGLDPRCLELELTESILMQNASATIATLQALSSLGIQISIDDFGTGYSSLSYLKRFPINALKIDRSFVRDITSDPDDAAITTAIIAMAKSLNLKVIAEGVETAEQLAFLRRHQCDNGQGYYFSQPVAAEAFALYLRDTLGAAQDDALQP